MRDFLTHRYFDTAFAVIEATVTHDLPPLASVIARLRTESDTEESV